jgi:hypothetical protein
MRDRRRYLHWVFEAKKRFGLSVLDLQRMPCSFKVQGQIDVVDQSQCSAQAEESLLTN